MILSIPSLNVAQQTWKSDGQVAMHQSAQRQESGIFLKEVNVLNQGAAPKQEAVKETKVLAQTHPIPAGITYPHTCG